MVTAISRYSANVSSEGSGSRSAGLIVDVVVPARDCAATVAEVVARVPPRKARSIVVVDYGSRDGTAQAARDAGAVVLRTRGGYGGACKRAVDHLQSLPTRPDVVAFVPGDGSYNPAAAFKLVAVIAKGDAELVIGRQRERPPVGARLATGVATGLIGAIYGHHFGGMGALRAIRFPALVALGLTDAGDGYNAEMQVKAVRFGLHVAEVPVSQSEVTARGIREKLETGSRVLFHILRHATTR